VGAPGPSGRCPETSNGHVHPQRRNVQLARERVSAIAESGRSGFDQLFELNEGREGLRLLVASRPVAPTRRAH
jgi:hypothetical protein